MTKNITQEDVEAFCKACTFFKIIYDHYNHLFEKNEERLKLLEETALGFFHDLQHVMIEYIFLQACKVTDPAMHNGKGGTRHNLTVRFFLENTDLSNEPSKAEHLKGLSDKLHEFREKVEIARHRRISHLDRDTALQNLNLGGFKYGEFETFLVNLEEFVNIIHSHYTGNPRDLGSYSDAHDLILRLKHSQYFKKLSENPEISNLIYDIRNASDYKKA